MLNLLRPILVGLLTIAGPLSLGATDVPSRAAEVPPAALDVVVPAGSEFSRFSHDESLAYSQDALGRSVQGIVLRRTDGSAVTIEEYRGKPLLISMVFSSCHHVCPTTTKFLAEAVAKANEAMGADSFQVLSIGFDTPVDTPERMGQFQRSTGVEVGNWEFLSGDAENMALLTRQLGFVYYPSPRGFDHLIQATIIDPEGVIYRQIYGMSFPTPTLLEPLKEQVFGQPSAPSALDYLENRVRLFCTVYDPATDTYHVDASVFIGTTVGIMVSILFGIVLVGEWRKSIKAG